MKKSEDFLRSNDLLFTVLENTPFGIIVLDQKGMLLWINNQAKAFLDIDKTNEELHALPVENLLKIHTEFLHKIKSRLIKKGKSIDLEGYSFQDRYLTCRGRIISEGIILTVADITNIKMSEFLSMNSMLEGQEMERKRLAREIHDGIGPLLSTLKMNLANIEDEISNHQELEEKFNRSYELIDEVSNDLRSISHNLLPKVLLDFGLVEALETLSEKIHTTKNLSMSFIYTGPKKRFDQVLELGVYRVCQELINNTLKHAKAKNITMQLIYLENMLRLFYEDDGLGFNLEHTPQGLGIMNIDNRIKAFGGEVILDSLPGKGMTATIEIPLNMKPDAAN